MEGHPSGSIWPTTDFNEVQIREVFSRYGLAMYLAQVLEHGMVNALLVLRLMPTMKTFPDRTAWEAQVDRFYDVELAKTFGNMIRVLEDLQVFSEDLLQRLRAAKLQRDYLAHRFFRTHDSNFMIPDGRTRMIAECETLIETFEALDREVEAIVDPQRQRFGITREWIDQQVASMEAKAWRDASSRLTN